MKWAVIILIAGGLAYFLYPLYSFLTITGNVKSELQEIECFGTIIDVTETQPCFSNITVKQSHNTVELSVCTCGLTAEFWDFTKTGDKIEKSKGEFIVFIINKTTGEKKEFEYPYCFH